MCGIIGYVGHRPCQEILFDGLKRLEYRGYDSAGLAWREDGRIECSPRGRQPRLARVPHSRARAHRAPGAIDRHGRRRCRRSASDTPGGRRTAASPRRTPIPTRTSSGRVWIVLNGIIENHLELRERLAADLIECSSDTDAEVVAHLIALHYDGDLADAVRRSLGDLRATTPSSRCATTNPTRSSASAASVRWSSASATASSSSPRRSRPSSPTRDAVVLHDGEIVVLRPR